MAEKTKTIEQEIEETLVALGVPAKGEQTFLQAIKKLDKKGKENTLKFLLIEVEKKTKFEESWIKQVRKVESEGSEKLENLENSDELANVDAQIKSA